MRANRFPMVLAVAACLGAGVLSASEPLLERTASEAREAGRQFALVIEQNGVQAVVHDQEVVELSREPFIIWVVYVDTETVMLQVSPVPLVYDAIGPGYEMARRLAAETDRVMALAELEFNVERTLYLDRFATHYLLAPHRGWGHRFNRVYVGNLESDFAAGGRDVEIFQDQSDDVTRRLYPVRETPHSTLYVTAFTSQYHPDFVPEILEFTRVQLTFY